MHVGFKGEFCKDVIQIWSAASMLAVGPGLSSLSKGYSMVTMVTNESTEARYGYHGDQWEDPRVAGSADVYSW